MFKKVISVTPLTTEDANMYFDGRIYGSNYIGDVSFIATLRALMSSRLPDGRRIHLYHGSSTASASDLEELSKKEIVRYVLSSGMYDEDEDDAIYIHNVTGTEDGNQLCMEALSNEFENEFGGFHKLQDVTNLYRKTFDVLCFVNPEKRQTLLFVTALNIRKYHYLQCSILGIMPWYFNPELGITEAESALIYSLREKTSDKYEDIIVKMAEHFNFSEARVRKLLQGFETRYERREIDAAKKNIERSHMNINAYNEQIGKELRLLNEYNIRLLGLQTKVEQNDGSSEIMDYFLCNRRLYLETIGSDDSMVFCVRDYLTYFDESMVKSCLKNNNSFVYAYCNDRNRSCPITSDQMRKLMTAIFIDQTIRVKFCAAYRFLMNGDVKGLDNHTYPAEFRGYMPNPHIDRYHCMGSYSVSINKLLRENKYIEAIEQCIASCKSLNWGDGVVMSTFFDRMTRNREDSVFELPDGRNVNIMEAIAWLENAENADGKTEEA